MDSMWTPYGLQGYVWLSVTTSANSSETERLFLSAADTADGEGALTASMEQQDEMFVQIGYSNNMLNVLPLFS
jgi:hypothetical protein